MNPRIYEQPLVLFLGAGASVPLGKKTTSQFLTWLGEQADVGQFVTSVKRLIQQNEVGQIDVEDVLDFVESVLKSGTILRKLAESAPVEIRPWADHTLRDIIKLSEYQQHSVRIKDLVIEHYGQLDEQRVMDLYAPFFKKLAQFFPLPVFTTNYDLAMEKLHDQGIIEIIDSFDHNRLIPKVINGYYDLYQPQKGNVDIVLFKLHGSVDWVTIPSGDIQRVNIPKSNLGGAPRTIAYPSQLKREIHEEPFRTNYDYLIACLLKARVCAVIGFSFRDQEVVEEFRQAMNLNEELKLIIIDPNAEVIADRLEEKVGFSSQVLDSPGTTPRRAIVTVSESFTFETAAGIAEKIARHLQGI